MRRERYDCPELSHFPVPAGADHEPDRRPCSGGDSLGPAGVAGRAQEVLLLAVGRGGLPAAVPRVHPGGVQFVFPAAWKDRLPRGPPHPGELPARRHNGPRPSCLPGRGRGVIPERPGPLPVGDSGAYVGPGGGGDAPAGGGVRPAHPAAGVYGGEALLPRVRERQDPLPLCAGHCQAQDLPALWAGAPAAGVRPLPRDRPHPPERLPDQTPGVFWCWPCTGSTPWCGCLST